MATRNNGKPKQMSEANESESEPSIVPIKLYFDTLNISKSSFITRYRNNNTDMQEVKSSEVKKHDKKRSRSPSREEEDDGTDIHHLIDYTVRSRYGHRLKQHVRSQSWEEEDKKSNQSSFIEEEDDGPNDQDDQTENDNRPLAHHQLKRCQSSEEDVEKEQQENTEFTSSQEEQIEKELCIEYSMEAIIDSEDEALGCCFDYSHRLSDKD